MRHRRSTFQKSIEVLNCIQQGESKPTRIMSQCNLSWNNLQDIFNRLLNQNLINRIDSEGDKRSKEQYNLTDKGMRVVQYSYTPEVRKSLALLQ